MLGVCVMVVVKYNYMYVSYVDLNSFVFVQKNFRNKIIFLMLCFCFFKIVLNYLVMNIFYIMMQVSLWGLCFLNKGLYI